MLRAFILVLAMLFSACSNSDFAGTAGRSKDSKDDSEDDDETDGDDDVTDAGDTDGDGDSDGVTDADDADDSGGNDSDTTDGDLNGSDSGAVDEGDIMTDEEIAKIAGVDSVKVGVNFEDKPGGDNDRNDAVLCFEGRFKVDSPAGNVISLKNQEVKASTFSDAGCSHDVRVEIHHDDGTKETPVTFDSKSGQYLTLKFKKKSKLEVFFKSKSGSCPQTERNMHETAICEVAANVCNNK